MTIPPKDINEAGGPGKIQRYPIPTPRANGDGDKAGETSHPRVVITLLSTVEPRSLTWLWKHRIPMRMVTLVAGDGGLGKSTLMLDVAARVTRGDWMPGDFEQPGDPAGVVILSSEDDLASVIVPRLNLARADLSRVATVGVPTGEGDTRAPLVCTDDLLRVEEAVNKLGAKLVILDPLVAFSPEDANLHHNQDARRVVARLHTLAERAGIAVVGIHHFNRGQHQDAVHRLTGSTGLANAARSVLVVGPDPRDDTGERRLLALAKRNLAPHSTQSMAYRLSVEPDQEHPSIAWDGLSDVTANDLVAIPADPERRTQEREADAWLRERLSVGPIRAAEAEQAGFDKSAMFRARRRVGVEAERDKNGWWWRIRKDSPDPWPWQKEGCNHTPIPYTREILQPSQSSLSFNRLPTETGGRFQDSEDKDTEAKRPAWTTSGSDEWYTPWEVVRELEKEFGPFELDPCATSASIPGYGSVAKAPRFFTKEQDGLSQPWAPARVFMNPPFTQGAEFTEKAVREARAGALVVALLPVRADAKWWHRNVMEAADDVRFLEGRIKYFNPHRGKPGSPPFGSAVVVYRPSQVSAVETNGNVAQALAEAWDPVPAMASGFGEVQP